MKCSSGRLYYPVCEMKCHKRGGGSCTSLNKGEKEGESCSDRKSGEGNDSRYANCDDGRNEVVDFLRRLIAFFLW